MAIHSGFTLAREWVIGIVLASIIPLTTFYSVEVYYTYIKPQPNVHQQYSAQFSATERDTYWEQQRKNHEERSLSLFYVSLIVGIASIIIGNFLFSKHLSLLIGFSLGGLFTLIMGYFRHWMNFTLLIKFGSLIGALILIFIIAFYHLKKEKQSR